MRCRRWMEFIKSRNPDFLRKNGVGPNFADWLAPDGNTNQDLLATAYWALIANMMSQMAHAVGKDADARRYDDVVQNIRTAFQKAYIKEDGEVGTGTQTSYVVALYTKMAPQISSLRWSINWSRTLKRVTGIYRRGFSVRPSCFSLSPIMDALMSLIAFC